MLGCTLVVRLLTAPAFVESADGWAFVGGVERYSVVEGRPHWPGYPLYIALGKFFRVFTADAVVALHLVAVLSSTLAAWPLMALVGRWSAAGGAPREEAERAAAFAGFLWMVLPGSWLTGTEILSDSTGLLLSTVLLHVSWNALEGGPRSLRRLAIGGALSAALIAVRAAYFPLVAPFFFAATEARAGVRRLGKGTSSALMMSAPIVVALAIYGLSAEPGYMAAAVQRWHEHFGDWPRRFVQQGHLWQRLVGLVRAFVVYGCGGWWPGLSLGRLLPLAALVALLGAGLIRLHRHPKREVRVMAALFGGPYAAFTLFTQDMSLVRYSLPLLALACLVAALGLPPGKPGLVTALAAWASVAAVSVPLGLEQRTSPPLGHRLAEYARDHIGPDGTIVVTTDVQWVVPFLTRIAPRTPVNLVEAEELWPAARGLRDRGQAVYATRPPATAPEQWTPVACFQRGRLLQSRGPYELWLYELGPRRGSVPPCG